jgi:hypothetical protein
MTEFPTVHLNSRFWRVPSSSAAFSVREPFGLPSIDDAIVVNSRHVACGSKSVVVIPGPDLRHWSACHVNCPCERRAPNQEMSVSDALDLCGVATEAAILAQQ